MNTRYRSAFVKSSIIFCLLILSGCGGGSSDSGGGTQTASSPTLTRAFDHYNPRAWSGTGLAIVMCGGTARMTSCQLNGMGMLLHPWQDRGRDIWTILRKTDIGGTIICTRPGGQTVGYSVKGNAGIDFGKC